jgi:hypothetical protein
MYGRVNPATYLTAITAQSTTVTPAPTPKGFLMALTDAQQQLIYDRLRKYVDSPISQVPKKTWGITILRGGKNVSALQELADAKTLIIKQQATIDALIAKLAVTK